MRRITVLLAVLAGTAACTPPSDDPPQSHVGTCTHYQNATRQLENVPNCELRSRDTLINGLQPANPGNKS